MKFSKSIILTFLVGLCFTTAVAMAAEPKKLADEAFDNNMFSNENARFTVVLEISKKGKLIRTREITALVKRKDGLISSFVEFQKPADVSGTRFLSVESSPGNSQQFIYLPAFKKTKRIVGTQKGKSFMGTDFSYSDLEGRDVEESNWKRLPDEKIQGEDCHVIEGRPKNLEDEQYGRIVLWIHKKNKIPLRSDFYDRKAAKVLKRLTVKKLGKKDGQWIIMDSVMETILKKSQTRMKVIAVDLKTPVSDDALTREALER